MPRRPGPTWRTPNWPPTRTSGSSTSNGPNGQHLGPVGSRIVAETLWTLAKHARDSVITTPPTKAELDTGEFTLKGIVKLGLDAQLPPLD